MQNRVEFSLPMSQDSICGDQIDETVCIIEGERYNDACAKELGLWLLNNSVGGNSITHENPDFPFPIYRNLNATRFRNQILQPVAIQHIRANRGIILMQDNATPHTAKKTQQMVQAYTIRLLDQPACSPDLNPIGHIWAEIDGRVRQLPQSHN